MPQRSVRPRVESVQRSLLQSLLQALSLLLLIGHLLLEISQVLVVMTRLSPLAILRGISALDRLIFGTVHTMV